MFLIYSWCVHNPLCMSNCGCFCIIVFLGTHHSYIRCKFTVSHLAVGSTSHSVANTKWHRRPAEPVHIWGNSFCCQRSFSFVKINRLIKRTSYITMIYNKTPYPSGTVSKSFIAIFKKPFFICRAMFSHKIFNLLSDSGSTEYCVFSCGTYVNIRLELIHIWVYRFLCQVVFSASCTTFTTTTTYFL